MRRPRPAQLLGLLLGLLAARGLAPEALDPWRAWVVFKEFARASAEDTDHGVSVQVDPLGPEQPVQLHFTRQVLEPVGDRLEPIGAVVVRLTCAPRRRAPARWEAWSFDYASFARFVDIVEQDPVVADLLVGRALASSVSWVDL